MARECEVNKERIWIKATIFRSQENEYEMKDKYIYCFLNIYINSILQ